MLRRSALLSSVAGLAHGFTTRAGPAELCDGSGLSLAPGCTPAAWSWVAAQLGMPVAPVALVSQIHGAAVLPATQGGLGGSADALVTLTPGLLLAVRVADCVPVLVTATDAAGRSIGVAAIHAGWRGLAAGVIPEAVQALAALVSQALPSEALLPDATAVPVDLRAAVGPCIETAAYEVTADVVDGIGARVPAHVFVRPGRRPGHWQADLAAAAGWQLSAAGVGQVQLTGGGTFGDPQLHSFRRDGQQAGRMAAVIGLRS